MFVYYLNTNAIFEFHFQNTSDLYCHSYVAIAYFHDFFPRLYTANHSRHIVNRVLGGRFNNCTCDLMMQVDGRYSNPAAWIYPYYKLIIYYSFTHNASQDLCLGNCRVFFKFSINHYDAFLVTMPASSCVVIMTLAFDTAASSGDSESNCSSISLRAHVML